MKSTVTTLLDTLGLLLFAAGVGASLWPVHLGAALIGAAIVITIGSAVAARPPKQPAKDDAQ